LLGILGLEHLGMGFDRLQVKTHAADGKTGGCCPSNLDKLPAGEIHAVFLLSFYGLYRIGVDVDWRFNVSEWPDGTLTSIAV
jgi:hypothetical protein